MKTLIVYDSFYGNTEKIAQAIAKALAKSSEVKLIRPDEANPSQFGSVDLLIVGSPTQGGRHTKAIQGFLEKIPSGVLKSINVAAFDTRLSSRWVKIFGYAAGRIADSLKKKGGNLLEPPEGFKVNGREGPLKEGELERAANWAEDILRKAKDKNIAER